MKKVQFVLDEELDAALGRMADEQGVSKSEFVRQLLRERVGPIDPLPPIHEDPLWQMIGMADPISAPSRVEGVIDG